MLFSGKFRTSARHPALQAFDSGRQPPRAPASASPTPACSSYPQPPPTALAIHTYWLL